METKSHVPSFTVSLRGYDREEVDLYLDSLAEALSQVSEAEQHTRRLQAHVARCNARIKELEDRIRADTPKSGSALGERIGMLLHEAEEAAGEMTATAEAEAGRIVAAAEQRAAETDERVRRSTALAEEQAHRIESVARGEAAEIVSEAEARAAARTRQIEQWAEQVVSHTRAEEARMLAEHRRNKAAKDAELVALEEDRLSAIGMLTDLGEMLSRATATIAEPVIEAAVEPAGPAEPAAVVEMPAVPAAAAEAESVEAEAAAIPMPPIAVDTVEDDADRTGEIEVVTADRPINDATARLAAELYDAFREEEADEESVGVDPAHGDEEFETKLDAWVSGGGR